MGVGGQYHAPIALTPGQTWYPLYRRLGGLQSRSGRVRKISPTTGMRSPDRPARSESLRYTTLSRPTVYFYKSFIIIYPSHSTPYAITSATKALLIKFIHSFISIQPWRPGLAGTRAQSCNRHGSGTLHLGKILGGSLPLLSPAFRRSHFSRQVPPSATTREILAEKGGTVGEKDVR